MADIEMLDSRGAQSSSRTGMWEAPQPIARKRDILNPTAGHGDVFHPMPGSSLSDVAELDQQNARIAMDRPGCIINS